MPFDTQSSRSYATTLQSSPDDPEVMAQDVVRMDKVHRKLKGMLMQRGPNGIPGFTRMFSEIDRTWTQRLTVWEFRKFFQSIDVKLNGKDLEALFIYYDTDGDGELDYDEFLLALRNRIDMTQQQLEDIVRKVRLRLLQRQKDNPRAALENALRRESPTTLSRSQFIRAMMGLSLSVPASDYNFLFQQLSTASDSPIPYVEVKQVADDILLEPAPEQQLDNMHQKLIDAMKDRDRTTSGTAGLLRVLRKVDMDHSGQLPREEFKRAMKAYGCGLIDKEIDQCFDFYCDQSTQRLHVHEFIRSMRDALGADEPPELVAYLFGKLRNILTWKGNQGIITLRNMFTKYSNGSGELSLWDCVCAIRDIGVGGILADVELEMMYNSVADDYDRMNADRFIDEVRGEISEGKMDIILQAWNRLDPTGTGTCPFDTLMNAFKPSRMPEVQSNKKTEKDVMTMFYESFDNGTGIVAKHTFVSFWGNFSVSVPDNNEFNLLVWNAFDLSKHPTKNTPVRSSEGSQAGSTTPKVGRRRFDYHPVAGPSMPMPLPQTPAQPAARVEKPPEPAATPAPAAPPVASPYPESVRSGGGGSGGYATRRIAPQPSDRRPVEPLAPVTPPRPSSTGRLSPVPSPELSPDPNYPSSPVRAGPAAPANGPSPARSVSFGRGQKSWGGGETHVNVFNHADSSQSKAMNDGLRVTGSRGRQISESARREFMKERPF